MDQWLNQSKPNTIDAVQASVINYTGHFSDESPGARLFSAAFSFSFSYSATSSNFGGRVGRGGTEKHKSKTVKNFHSFSIIKRYMHIIHSLCIGYLDLQEHSQWGSKVSYIYSVLLSQFQISNNGSFGQTIQSKK